MISSTALNNICNYIVTLLFTSSAEQINKIKVSAIDTEASLLSELSSLNNDIQDAIEFNCSLITSEYIDYLKSEISKINSITMDFNTASDLVDFTKRTRDVCGASENMLFKNMFYTQDRISKIIGYDIAKSTELKPISQSKTTDFILSVKERLNELHILCGNISDAITQCEHLAEACNFALFYKENVIDKYDGIPPILEENYNSIMINVSAEYHKWKEDKNNVNSSKDNI